MNYLEQNEVTFDIDTFIQELSHQIEEMETEYKTGEFDVDFFDGTATVRMEANITWFCDIVDAVTAQVYEGGFGEDDFTPEEITAIEKGLTFDYGFNRVKIG